jgi:phage minor structural protein
VSYPILYSATETSFGHNGIGILSACVACEVVEEANGIFELAMQYPADGIHFESIAERSIIKAKPDQFRDHQLFRVYSISKPMYGIVSILAQHISYDLSGIPVAPFEAQNVNRALSGLKTNAVVDCPFNFWTDKTTSAKFSVKTPSSIRSRLGGVSGSILDAYGGEYEFDNYTVKLHNNRGMNRGVSIRYGKNLTDIKQDQNCSNVATGIYPYWALQTDVGDVLVELPEKIVNATGEYNFTKIRTVDFTQEFQVQPTEEQLRLRAKRYIRENEIGVPSVSMTVSFAQLEQSEEYKHLKLLERVGLFDTVNVEFPALKVSATAKVVKVVYDVISDRVKSATLGSVRSNIADTIATQQKEIEKKPSKTFMQTAIESLTKTILGAKGGSVRLLDTDSDGEPDTLYIADNPDPMQAKKIWRFNYEGWGATDGGYDGQFTLGATLKDGIVADFITAGTLYGLLFKAGFIESLDGKIKIDLQSANMPIFNTGIQTNNKFVVVDEFDNSTLFKVSREKYGDVEYSDISGFNDNGEYIFHITKSFDATSGQTKGTAFSVHHGNSDVSVSVSDNNMSFVGQSSGGYFNIDVNNNELRLILPGDNSQKKVSWKKSEELGCYVLCGE